VLASVATGLFVFSRKQSKRIKNQFHEIQQLQSELTHRTANFFTSIKGMLSAAIVTTTDKNTIASIDKRVNTINHLYKMLYSSTYKHSNFSELLAAICNDLEHSYGSERQIHIYSKCTALVEKKEATPLAFIITELITNCYKHAFTEQESGEVHVEITKEEGLRLLHVWDDGKGLSEGTIPDAKSQGMNIIKNYCATINGTMNYFNHDGLHFKLSF
jgi:two-component sensor histidine kinase